MKGIKFCATRIRGPEKHFGEFRGSIKKSVACFLRIMVCAGAGVILDVVMSLAGLSSEVILAHEGAGDRGVATSLLLLRAKPRQTSRQSSRIRRTVEQFQNCVTPHGRHRVLWLLFSFLGAGLLLHFVQDQNLVAFETSSFHEEISEPRVSRHKFGTGSVWIPFPTKFCLSRCPRPPPPPVLRRH